MACAESFSEKRLRRMEVDEEPLIIQAAPDLCRDTELMFVNRFDGDPFFGQRECDKMAGGKGQVLTVQKDGIKGSVHGESSRV